MKALTTLWARLTEPHPSVIRSDERHRAHLLSVILIALGPMTLITVILTAWTGYVYLGFFDPLLLTLEFFILLGFFTNYALSRTRHVTLSAWILVCTLFVGVFAVIIQSPQYKTSAIFLPLPLLVAGLILTLRESHLVFFATLAGIMLLPALGVDWETAGYITIFITEIFFAVIIFLSNDLREQYIKLIERQTGFLATNERRYRSLFEQIHDAVFLLDLHGNHLAANRRAAEMLGYSPEELLHLSFRETSGEVEESKEVQRNLLSGDHIPLYERVFRRKNGERFPVEINVELIRDEQGNPLHIQSVVREITERKRAEGTLQGRLNELSALYANISDLIQLRDLQEQLQVIVERAAKLLNTTSGGLYLCEPELQQVRCVVSYNTLRDYTGTTLKYGEGAAGRVALTGEPLIIEDYSAWHGRAAAYEEEKPFLSLLSVPMIWDQQVIGIIHVLHDTQRAFTEDHLKLLTVFAQQASLAVANARSIEDLKEARAQALASLHTSEQRAAELSEVLIALAALDFNKRAKVHGTNNVFDALATGVNMLGEELNAATRALREHEERLHFILSSSPAIIYTASLEENLPATYYSENVYSQTGFTPQQFTSDPQFWIEHVHPDDLEAVLTQMTQFLEKGEGVFEYRFRFADGIYHWIRDSARLVRSTGGEPREMIGSWIDITERRQAEERIEAALKEKEVLLREVYHRVKNNLQVVSSLLNLTAGQTPDANTRAVLKEMQSRVFSMALIHEKLYQSGDLAAVNLRDYLQALIDMLLSANNLTSEEIDVCIDIAPSIRFGLETAVPCGLIVNELVGNALKHAFPKLFEAASRRPPQIVIAVESLAGSRYTLKVADNGIGLPPSLNIHETETLGLQLVMMLAEQLNGNLELKREDGTAFKIEFSELDYAKRGG